MSHVTTTTPPLAATYFYWMALATNHLFVELEVSLSVSEIVVMGS